MDSDIIIDLNQNQHIYYKLPASFLIHMHKRRLIIENSTTKSSAHVIKINNENIDRKRLGDVLLLGCLHVCILLPCP